jgi:hypothetical protein
MYNIRTYNAISSKGLERFPSNRYHVASDCANPDGVLLRSQKLHSESPWPTTPHRALWCLTPQGLMPMP